MIYFSFFVPKSLVSLKMNRKAAKELHDYKMGHVAPYKGYDGFGEDNIVCFNCKDGAGNVLKSLLTALKKT